MTELANHVLLSPSGLTRLVERMERQRLLERRTHPGDARSSLAVLTTEGSARLKESRATHDRVIRSLFLGRLSETQLGHLRRAWASASKNR